MPGRSSDKPGVSTFVTDGTWRPYPQFVWPGVGATRKRRGEDLNLHPCPVTADCRTKLATTTCDGHETDVWVSLSTTSLTFTFSHAPAKARTRSTGATGVSASRRVAYMSSEGSAPPISRFGAGCLSGLTTSSLIGTVGFEPTALSGSATPLVLRGDSWCVPASETGFKPVALS